MDASELYTLSESKIKIFCMKINVNAKIAGKICLKLNSEGFC
jgi:hypothetical protein